MAHMCFKEAKSQFAWAALNNLLFANELPMTEEPSDSWSFPLPATMCKLTNHLVDQIRQKFDGEIVADYTLVPPPDFPVKISKQPKYNFSYWNLMR